MTVRYTVPTNAVDIAADAASVLRDLADMRLTAAQAKREDVQSIWARASALAPIVQSIAVALIASGHADSCPVRADHDMSRERAEATMRDTVAATVPEAYREIVVAAELAKLAATYDCNCTTVPGRATGASAARVRVASVGLRIAREGDTLNVTLGEDKAAYALPAVSDKAAITRLNAELSAWVVAHGGTVGQRNMATKKVRSLGFRVK